MLCADHRGGGVKARRAGWRGLCEARGVCVWVRFVRSAGRVCVRAVCVKRGAYVGGRVIADGLFFCAPFAVGVFRGANGRKLYPEHHK